MPRPRRILVVFKTHLDIGYTDLAAAVLRRYCTRFIPRALATARELREAGGPDRFVWTTGSWLITAKACGRSFLDYRSGDNFPPEQDLPPLWPIPFC